MTTAPPPSVHILGIRHHGPGSARSLGAALAALAPDAILIEGPPDADPLIELAAREGMEPPVALLIYRPEAPKQAVYYPFALFSPEWQAIRFALAKKIPVRFMDLPMKHQLGLGPEEPGEKPESEANGDGENPPTKLALRLRIDPLQVLAEAAGFGEGERWWEHVVEHRRDGADLFAAILEAMAEVRHRAPPIEDPREQRREAYMRRTIRAAKTEGRRRIAVVCGAWHSPVLAEDRWPPVAEDDAILAGLPEAKVDATWVPWTHGRLGYESGYGAGVESPGWYHHLWTSKDHVSERWMTRVARLLRNEGLDASSASAIEAVRLAEALAALRDRHLPGLEELNEASQAIFCFGDDVPMRLIRRKLIVGEALGRVPDDTPTVPLIRDLERLQKRLRLPPDPAQATKVLDLREANDLERSRLLHRLGLLGVPWGGVQQASGMGTFKEAWRLQWQPEFAVSLIEASLWGTTVVDAASAKADDLAEKADDLAALTFLLDRAILADLAASVERIMARLEARAAVASDVTQLMNALPPLASLLRYGNVRKTDAATVAHATNGIVARICVGLPGACSSLDDDAATEMFGAIQKANAALDLIEDPEHLGSWHATLSRMSSSDRLHGLVAGRCVRILLDARALDSEEAARRMNLAVSTAAGPPQAAAWIDGFLRGSGELLYHDDALFGIFDGWLASLSDDAFPQLLPLLRRTFSTFEAPLRRNLGEKARRGAATGTAPAIRPAAATDFDDDRAARVLPLLARMLGLDSPETT
jgi:hypothetical protein